MVTLQRNVSRQVTDKTTRRIKWTIECVDEIYLFSAFMKSKAFPTLNWAVNTADQSDEKRTSYEEDMFLIVQARWTRCRRGCPIREIKSSAKIQLNP